MNTTHSPVLTLLGRGLAAGGLAGLASGLFSLLAAGPLLDRAIEWEEARSAADDGHAHETGAAAHTHSHAEGAEELFSRGTQHFGLVVTAIVTGLAVGVLFAIAYALIHRATALSERPWPRALTLAGAGFLAVSLLPALRYPASPPGVGDSGTVTDRQLYWVAAMLIGVLGVAAAWLLHRRLREHGEPARQLAAAGAVVATLIAVFLLPGNPDEVPVAADLVWDFRVLSLAAHALLWAGLGIAFGWLGLRQAVPEGRPETAGEPRPV